MMNESVDQFQQTKLHEQVVKLAALKSSLLQKPDQPESQIGLKVQVEDLLGNTTLIPKMVFTSSGVHVFSDTDRELLTDQIRSTDPKDPLFWERAQGIVDNALIYAEEQDRKEQEDFQRIHGKRQEAAKIIYSKAQTNESYQAWEKQQDALAEKIIASDPTSEFSDDLIDALCSTPQFSVPGEYIKQKRVISKNILVILSRTPQASPPDAEDSETIYNLTQQLLTSGNSSVDGHQMLSSDIITSSNADKLAVILEEFHRFPSQRARNWSRLKAVLFPSINLALSPERAIDVMIPLSAEEKNSPDLTALRDSFAEIQQLYYYTHVQDQVDKYYPHESERKTYLKSLVLEKMALSGRISPTLAYEMLQDNEVLNQSLKSIISGLTNELGTNYTPTEELSKKSKTFSKLIVAAALVAVLSQTNPQDYINVGQRILDWAQSEVSQVKKPHINEEALSKLTPKDETPEPAPNTTAEKTPTPTPTPKPVETKASPKDKLPDRNYDGKGLTKDNLHWTDYAGEAGGTHSAKVRMSPEGFLNQASTIAWEILNKGDLSTSYLSEQISPIYDPETNTFKSEGFSDDSVNWHTPTGYVGDAEIQLTAKRTTVDRYISVPAPWSSHIDSVSVFTLSGSSNFEDIPAEVGTTPTGQLLIKLPSSYDFGSGEKKVMFIKVGIGKKFDRTIDTSFLNKDKDATFPNPTVLPKQVLDMIDNLNHDESQSDLQKLNQLRSWFVNNGTYTFDERYYNYYFRGNPTDEQFLRRFFGTGDTTEDPNYIDDPAYVMKGICESFNTTYATAARMLDLKDGQVVMASGFIHSGFFSSKFSSNLTYGQLHAWAVYITNDNVHIDLDATANTLDELTRQVLNKAQAGNESGANGFRPQEAPPSETERKAVRDTTISNLYNETPIPQRIEEVLTLEQPINSWKLTEPDPEIFKKTQVAVNRGFNETLYEDFSFTFSEGKWTSYFPNPNKVINYNLSSTFPDQIGSELEDQLAKENLTIEDFAPEIVGLVRLTGNAIMLPNTGSVSPRSIVVNRLSKNEDGSIKREPLPVAGLKGDSLASSYFQLVIDEDPKKLAWATVEIKYKTFVASSKISLNSEKEAQSLFKPIIPKEYFSKDFQKLIEAIDKINSPEDIEALDLGKINPELLLSFARAWDNYGYTDLKDRIKVDLIEEYISYNYHLTWNQSWSTFYQGNKTSPPEQFWKRVTTYKRIDPETALTLLAGAASNLKSSQGNFNIPMITQTSYRDFSTAGPMRLFQQPIGGYPDNKGLFTQSERSINPGLLRLEPSRPTDPNGQLNFHIDGGFGYFDYFHMQLDPLSANSASATLQNLLSKDALENPRNSKVLESIERGKLTPQQRFEKSVQEWIALRSLNWFFNEPWVRDVAISFAISFLITDHLRRRTHWWRGIDAAEYKKILGTVAIEYGITSQDHPVYRYLNDFYEQVLQPFQDKRHIPILSLAQKARAMDKFIATEKKRVPEKDDRLFEFSKSQYLNRNAKDVAKEWLHGTREYHKIRELATSETAADAATRKIARRMMHRMYHQPFVPDLLKDRVDTLTQALQDSLNQFPDIVVMVQPTVSLELKGVQTARSLDNPEQFTTFLQDLIKRKYRVATLIKGKKMFTTNLPPELDVRVQQLRGIAARSLLPYYQLIEAERRELERLNPPKKTKKKR